MNGIRHSPSFPGTIMLLGGIISECCHPPPNSQLQLLKGSCWFSQFNMYYRKVCSQVACSQVA
jgi:hypothetical protein